MPINSTALIEFLQALVRLPSPAGEERAVVECAAAEMRRLGFDQVFVDENGSLVGIVDGAQPGPTLLFDGHCDTVGVAPGISWQHDPFGAAIEDGRMYGRGTSDMKGAIAAMIHAAGAVDCTRLAGRVVVSVSVMEEVLEGAALRTVMERTQPDFVVIGEATDLDLVHGGRGRAEIQLEAVGRPAHSSTPHLGDNAVLKMLPAIQAIQELSLPSDPLLGPAIMALTDIISEPYPAYSVLPSRCRVTYDRRLLAGETPEGVLAELRALPALQDIGVTIAQGEHQTYTGAVLRGLKFLPAWKLSPEDPFVAAALAGLRSAGLDLQLGAYRFCTNAAYSAGTAHVPTIGFGPGVESLAHVVDEYVEVDQVLAAARGYVGMTEFVLRTRSFQ